MVKNGRVKIDIFVLSDGNKYSELILTQIIHKIAVSLHKSLF